MTLEELVQELQADLESIPVPPDDGFLAGSDPPRYDRMVSWGKGAAYVLRDVLQRPHSVDMTDLEPRGNG